MDESGQSAPVLAESRRAAARAILAGRTSVVVLSAMSPQQPTELLRALIDTARDQRVRLRLLFADLEGSLGFVDEEAVRDVDAGHLELVSVAGAVPARLASRVGHFPLGLWDFDRAIADRRIRVDAFVARVHQVDGAATVSLGQMVGYSPAGWTAATTVCTEVASALPGLDSYEVDAADADISYPDPDYRPGAAKAVRPPTSDQARIASLVASLIPDGATLQLGLGTIPEAVTTALSGTSGLRIHSGILPASLCPTLAGRAFSTDPASAGSERHVATGVMAPTGPDGRPWPASVVLRPVSETHSPTVLMSVPRLWAINSAFEVDLNGRVNAEYVDGRRIAGGGGQADFCRGAHASPGGAAVIALPARTASGRPRIVPFLPPPGLSTSAPADIDAVVTEHGVALLSGLTAHERAEALVSVAHPEDRSALLGAISGNREGPAR